MSDIPKNTNKMASSVLYPISANPPTWGHADIMMRAAQKFNKVYWVVASNPHKPKSKITDDLKIQMMQAYVDFYKLDNVEVLVHSSTIIRLAQQVGANFLLRGLRNTTDFQMELELATGNRGIDKNIETICMFSKPHFATISSSLVRELLFLGEKIDQYVHPKVVEILSNSIK